MSRPRTTMQPPVHEDAVCPDCRTALEFGTDGNGRLLEWCRECERRATIEAAQRRHQQSVSITIQHHKATGFCTHAEGRTVCPFPQATGVSGNSCDCYCGKHCRALQGEHDCPRGWKRTYMRTYMRDYSARVRAQCARLYQRGGE